MPQVVIDRRRRYRPPLKLLTGECDVLAYPAASQLSILRDDPRLRLTLRPGMNIAYPRSTPANRHSTTSTCAGRSRWRSTTSG